MSAPIPVRLFHLCFSPRFQRYRLRAAFSLYGLIIVLGSIPGARASVGDYASGLVLHGTAYAFLSFLLFTGKDGSAPARAMRAVLTVMAMGALDELVQSFFPYRHAAVGDWLVDCSAALAASALLWALWPRLARA
jgi:VanZ family protein